jgi:HlyD family secretion protein
VARLDSGDLVQEVALRKAELRAAEAALAELTAGSRPEEIAASGAALQQAQARLDDLRAGSRPQEVAAAQATVARAKAELDRQQSELDRQKKLSEQKIITDREYETTVMAHDTAAARLKEAEEQLALVKEGPRQEQVRQAQAAVAQAEQQLALVKKGPREETIEQAKAHVEQAKAALALAGTHLGYATLTSPLSGVVLSHNVEPGEYVAPGTPVVTVADLQDIWLRAYVNETDLGRVKLGQAVRVTTDTSPGKAYEGRLTFISSEAEFTPKNVQTQKERVKLVYRVKVQIANPNMELKPGMPADGEILLGPGE